MMILAIDPGSSMSAFVLFDSKTEEIERACIVENDYLLGFLVDNTLSSQVMAIEYMQGFGMTVGQEVFDTMFWTGRFCQAYQGRRFELIGRKQIKIGICGQTSARDQDIRESLRYRFGEPGTKSNPGRLYGIKSHLWSALAVAVYCADQIKQTKSKP
jgi:hypothetical protein